MKLNQQENIIVGYDHHSVEYFLNAIDGMFRDDPNNPPVNIHFDQIEFSYYTHTLWHILEDHPLLK